MALYVRILKFKAWVLSVRSSKIDLRVVIGLSFDRYVATQKQLGFAPEAQTFFLAFCEPSLSLKQLLRFDF